LIDLDQTTQTIAHISINPLLQVGNRVSLVIRHLVSQKAKVHKEMGTIWISIQEIANQFKINLAVLASVVPDLEVPVMFPQS